MKGLELSHRFYREFGAPMLHNEFPEIENLIAVGLCGSGSECFGFDDEISKDHDFEPGFCLFLPDESLVDEKTAFSLERAYSALPKEFLGYKRSVQQPVGGKRHGVIRMGEFFKEKTGSEYCELSLMEWFFVPEQSLAEATNGSIFRDDSEIFTGFRKKIEYLPEDVRLKKLAGNILLMGQAGQYNYPRCISRGETAAAQLSLFEFVKSAMNVIFLLNKKYIPYYKWSFRALREMRVLSETYDLLEQLISTSNSDEQVKEKKKITEDICKCVIEELKKQNLSEFRGSEMEGHAYSVNNKISDIHVRNLHILYGV